MKKIPEENASQDVAAGSATTKAPKAKNGLRLVPAVVSEPTPLPPLKRKSQLASFFSAYADAIDNDVKMILDL